MKPAYSVLLLVGGLVGVALIASQLTSGDPTASDVAPKFIGPKSSDSIASEGPAYFADVTEESSVSLIYNNGADAGFDTILESLGGGVALFDYDGDGKLDLYATGGGRFSGDSNDQIIGLPGKLYRNLGDMKFRDMTAETGLDDAPFYTNGAVASDYDNDGWPDLLITGYGGLALYRNEEGLRFRDVTASMKLTDTRWATSAAFADLMGTGRSDLVVARYVDWSFSNHPPCPPRNGNDGRDVCPPQAFKALPSSVYRNDGEAFTEMWPELGVDPTGMGLGLIATDMNEDGRPDFYFANDASNNWLFLNRGDGQFVESAMAAGVAIDDVGRYNGSMGVDVGDYDGSGKASLWVTNFEGEFPALYQNLGREIFAYQSQAAGIGSIGATNVAFGTSFLDMDCDGWQDLVFVNGHVVRFPAGASVLQKPVLLRNEERRGKRIFVDVTTKGGPLFQIPALGRGLAVGDLDNDGWPDLAISHSNTPLAILRNAAVHSSEHHWIGLQLRGRNHRPIAGATVTVEVDGRVLTRFARSGGSYLSSSDPRLLFGVGKSKTVGTVKVRWPWGETQSWEGLTADAYWELVEGQAATAPVHAIR